MKPGIEYLKSIRVVTNQQVAKKLIKCSDANGGCDNCIEREECRMIYDARFTEKAVYMTIELKKEREIKKMLETQGMQVLGVRR